MDAFSFYPFVLKKTTLSEDKLQEILLQALEKHVSKEEWATLTQAFDSCASQDISSSVEWAFPSTQEVRTISQETTMNRFEERKDFPASTQLISEEETRAQAKTVLDSPRPPSFLSRSLAIEERYELLETLGEGGMGVVQRVRDRVLGREVALKQIKVKKSVQLTETQQQLLWRLHREASIMAILEHPHIVPLYDLERQGQGDLCFTMRKIEGETLRQIFNRKGERSEKLFFLGIF
jgi:primosomal protein N'